MRLPLLALLLVALAAVALPRAGAQGIASSHLAIGHDAFPDGFKVETSRVITPAEADDASINDILTSAHTSPAGSLCSDTDEYVAVGMIDAYYARARQVLPDKTDFTLVYLAGTYAGPDSAAAAFSSFVSGEAANYTVYSGQCAGPATQTACSVAGIAECIETLLPHPIQGAGHHLYDLAVRTLLIGNSVAEVAYALADDTGDFTSLRSAAEADLDVLSAAYVAAATGPALTSTPPPTPRHRPSPTPLPTGTPLPIPTSLPSAPALPFQAPASLWSPATLDLARIPTNSDSLLRSLHRTTPVRLGRIAGSGFEERASLALPYQHTVTCGKKTCTRTSTAHAQLAYVVSLFSDPAHAAAALQDARRPGGTEWSGAIPNSLGTSTNVTLYERKRSAALQISFTRGVMEVDMQVTVAPGTDTDLLARCATILDTQIGPWLDTRTLPVPTPTQLLTSTPLPVVIYTAVR